MRDHAGVGCTLTFISLGFWSFAAIRAGKTRLGMPWRYRTPCSTSAQCILYHSLGRAGAVMLAAYALAYSSGWGCRDCRLQYRLSDICLDGGDSPHLVRGIDQ